MPARTTASPIGSDSGNDDNIRVASAHQMSVDSSGDEDDPLSDLQKLEHLPRGQTTKSRTPTTKDKAPERSVDQDVDMTDADHANDDYDDDDNVTEYSFKSEDYVRDSELEEDDFDEEEVRSHISLSDDEPEVPLVNETPWRQMSREQREVYERMFGRMLQYPINNSWSSTEAYQQMQDSQCLNYLKDFPCSEWVIPFPEAELAVNKVLERVRFRAFDIKIYGSHGPHGRPQQPQMAPYHHSQSPVPLPGHPVPVNQTLHSQPQMHPSSVPNVNLSQPMRQTMGSAQSHYQPHGNVPMPVHPGQVMRTPPYSVPGQMPQQPFQPINPRNGAQGSAAKGSRKVKVSVAESTRRGSKPNEALSSAPPPLKAPTPPYPIRERPDPRKTVGKVGRGKTRRQAEADEFPWNRQLDFIQGRIASKSKDTWDDSVYDPKMLEEMARTRVRNAPVVEKLEKLISEKQKKSRNAGKRKKAEQTEQTEQTEQAEQSSEDEADGDGDGEGEDEDNNRRSKGGRKKLRVSAEAGNDPYHSGNFAFAGPEDQQLASTMGFRSVDELIEAGEADKVSMEDLFRIKICWSPGKKGNSQDLEQAKFSAKDTVITRKMLAKTPILTHRAGECIIDFCPDLLWRDILLRVLSEAGFSNKDIRDRFCLNGSFSDRATVAKRLGAALGKETNPPRKGQDSAMDWCETNRDDFDNYQAFFGKRPPARRTAQGRKGVKGKAAATGEDASPSTKTEETKPAVKKSTKMALDGTVEEATDGEGSDVEQGQGADDAVSLQDSDDLDAMSD